MSKWVFKGRLPSVGYQLPANLLRADVEALSAARWRPGYPSWTTAVQVADVLPYEVGRGGG